MRAWEFLTEQHSYSDRYSNKTYSDLESFSDRNRPRLTLRHLHKLRKMRDRHEVDQEKRSRFVKSMYNPEIEDEVAKPTANSTSKKDRGKEALKAVKDRQKDDEKNAKAAMKTIKDREKEGRKRIDSMNEHR